MGHFLLSFQEVKDSLMVMLCSCALGKASNHNAKLNLQRNILKKVGEILRLYYQLKKFMEGYSLVLVFICFVGSLSLKMEVFHWKVVGLRVW